MLQTDEDALICDLAETYHILNYRELSPLLVATLSVGLRDDSRIKLKMSGSKISLETLLMAASLDKLNYLAWTKTKAAEKGRNRPKSVVESLLGGGDKQCKGFESGKAFEEAYNAIVNRKKQNDGN